MSPDYLQLRYFRNFQIPLCKKDLTTETLLFVIRLVDVFCICPHYFFTDQLIIIHIILVLSCDLRVIYSTCDLLNIYKALR